METSINSQIQKTPILFISNKYKVLPYIYVLVKSKKSAKNLNKLLQKYLRNLPNREDTKAKRKLVTQINKKVQQEIGVSNFYLSLYTPFYYQVTVK